jgi:hypothetical protein
MPAVYVLNDPHTLLIKIGRATDLDERLANLRTGNPRLALIEWFRRLPRQVDRLKVEISSLTTLGKNAYGVF